MIRLKDILKETEEFQQLPSELKRHFLEIISTYGQHRESITRKSDIRHIAETLGAIADAATEYTLREGGDWFDRVTIKRNMNELKKLQGGFEKESIAAKQQEERLESLYEDMGHVLGRYFEIADISEDVMQQRLGLRESTEDCSSCREQELKNKKKQISEAFTRQHYEAIAKIVKSISNKNEKESVAEKFSDMFEKDNKLFNKPIFLKAAGI